MGILLHSRKYRKVAGATGHRWDAWRSPIGLEAAVAHATGISHGAAHTIGRLLLAEVGGRSLLDSIDARREEDISIGETSCYLIVSRAAKPVVDARLWVEKDL